MQNKDYTIIGGGASGILLLVQLLRSLKSKAELLLINGGYPMARGVAYSTLNEDHLLNVRAARMSMFPDQPDDFCNWIKSQPDYAAYHTDDLPEKFVPRILYGKYLDARLADAMSLKHPDVHVEIVDGEVTDIHKSEKLFELTLADNRKFTSNNVALCTGNFSATCLPGNVPTPDDPRIYVNPWKPDTTHSLDRNKPVLILGSSLTMADTVLSLLKEDYDGKIYVLSRHGKLPVAHPPVRLHYHEKHEFQPENDLQSLYRQVKERIYEASQNGFWEEPVLEAIRPHTQLIWQRFGYDEKVRFMRHLNHKWSILRHRLPMEISSLLDSLISSGRMKLLAGQLTKVTADDDHLKVNYINRQDGQALQLEVQRLINCAGPEANLEKIPMPMIRNMITKGLIRPCPMRLGYDATPDGRLLNKDGEVTEGLFTMGPGLKGILWESVAIPELRGQALKLAELMQRRRRE